MREARRQTADGSRIIAEEMRAMQTVLGRQFREITDQTQDGQEKQNHIVLAADSLVESLKEALQSLHLRQARRESLMQSNGQQLQALLQSNAELAVRHAELEKAALGRRKVLSTQEERRRTLNQQTSSIHQHQMNQQQMGAQGQVTWKMQQELSQMREANRNRTEITPVQRFTPLAKMTEQSPFSDEPAASSKRRVFGPKETVPPNTPITAAGPSMNHKVYRPSTLPKSSETGFAPPLRRVSKYGGGRLSHVHSQCLPELDTENQVMDCWAARSIRYPTSCQTDSRATIICENRFTHIHGAGGKRTAHSFNSSDHGYAGCTVWPYGLRKGM